VSDSVADLWKAFLASGTKDAEEAAGAPYESWAFCGGGPMAHGRLPSCRPDMPMASICDWEGAASSSFGAGGCRLSDRSAWTW